MFKKEKKGTKERGINKYFSEEFFFYILPITSLKVSKLSKSTLYIALPSLWKLGCFM
jgi:hypothetical protein